MSGSLKFKRVRPSSIAFLRVMRVVGRWMKNGGAVEFKHYHEFECYGKKIDLVDVVLTR